MEHTDMKQHRTDRSPRRAHPPAPPSAPPPGTPPPAQVRRADAEIAAVRWVTTDAERVADGRIRLSLIDWPEIRGETSEAMPSHLDLFAHIRGVYRGGLIVALDDRTNLLIDALNTVDVMRWLAQALMIAPLPHGFLLEPPCLPRAGETFPS